MCDTCTCSGGCDTGRTSEFLDRTRRARDRLEEASTEEISEDEFERLVTGCDSLGVVSRVKAWIVTPDTVEFKRAFYTEGWNGEEILVMRTSDDEFIRFHDKQEYERVQLAYSLVDSHISANVARMLPGF